MKIKIKNFILGVINPINWKNLIVNFIKAIPGIIKTVYLFITFFFLLLFFLFGKVYSLLKRIPLLGFIFSKLNHLYDLKLKMLVDKVMVGLEKTRSSEVKRSYLIELAYRNMMAKKTRAIITILGMSVGVGIIVLLLSLGYEIERLIISKVASLDELKIVDVSTGDNTTIRLNNTLMEKIKKMTKVSKVVPLISIVGKLTYNRANTDILVYAVSKEYLTLSKTKLVKGRLFAQQYDIYNRPQGQIAGAETELVDGKYNQPITGKEYYFNVNPEGVATVWEDCTISSKFLGYLPYSENGYKGVEYWGTEYSPFDKKGREAYNKNTETYLGRWVKSKVSIFDKSADGEIKLKLDEGGNQISSDVCLQAKYLISQGRLVPKLDDFGQPIWESASQEEEGQIQLQQKRFGQVLGESIGDVESASDSVSLIDTSSSSASLTSTTTATDSGEVEFVSLEASNAAQKKATSVLNFEKPPSGEAIVSSGMINLLSIPLNKAIGTKFKVSFIVVKSLKQEIEGRALTTETEYQIKGVVDDPDNSYFYIPITDMEKVGVTSYSQLKVVLTAQDALPKVRKDIEALGYRTNSTVDTVAQIESLFANLRIILAMLGLVALGVAALGMFNTLTVSLLERTREIGGMKTMGMVSTEVQDLFLAEAMIMGLSGGIGGLTIGYLIGKTMSLVVSFIAIANGQSYMELTYVPIFLTIFILISSFIVGVITGIYPAQRAKKISALNALRYE